MSGPKLFLDEGFGETRGVLTLAGRPHRLLIVRDDEPACQRLGARSIARVNRVERGLSLAFLQMSDGPDGLLPLSVGPAPVEGSALEIEVVAEARLDTLGGAKGPVVRVIATASGAPHLTADGPTVAERLQTLAPGVALTRGGDAREVCDLAQDEALARLHPLPGGGSIAIETTRALTSVDVDMGERGGSDAQRAARQINMASIVEAARLLRLKGLGGLVVFDLVGKGHDGAALSEAARRAFAPDGAGVSIGPISRFGLFELAVPHAGGPVADRLLDAAGQLSARTVAAALLRALEREGRAQPGSRLVGYCVGDVAEAAKPLLPSLVDRIGPRFQIETRPGLGRTFEVIAP